MSNTPIILVAWGLESTDSHCVSSDEARNFAEKQGFEYLEIGYDYKTFVNLLDRVATVMNRECKEKRKSFGDLINGIFQK